MIQEIKISLLVGYDWIRAIPELRKAKKTEEIEFNEKLLYTFLSMGTRSQQILDFEIEVRGQKYLQDIKTPVIFMGNHEGFLDGVMLPLQIYNDTKRKLTAISADLPPMRKYPIVKDLVKQNRVVLINRSNLRSQLETFKEVQKVIADGYDLLVFPEGEISSYLDPNEVKDGVGNFKPGAMKYATDSSSTIIPFVIKGSRAVYSSAWFDSSHKVERTGDKIVMEFLEPFEKHLKSKSSTKEIMAELENKVRTKYNSIEV